MIEPDYVLATNAAYEVLNSIPEFSSPTPIFYILRQFSNIKLFTFSAIREKYGLSIDKFYSSLSSEFGFTIAQRNSNKRIILYNENKSYESIRFTLAHELGHCVLEHKQDESTENKEANCFARNLLCPIPIVKGFGLTDYSQYGNLFYVSEPMAQVAFDFVNADYQNITTKNYQELDFRMLCYYNGMSPNELYGGLSY